MSKILITGGAGFIGSHLAHRLCENLHDVTIIDNLSNGSIKNIPERASFLEADIFDDEILDTFSKGRDYIFHLAAKISVPESMKNPKETMRINVGGTQKIIDSAIKHEVKRIIFASSAAVYGDASEPCREDGITEPTSPYGKSKLISESLLRKCPVETVSLRYFNVYGKRQKDSVIVNFITNMAIDRKPLIYGDGSRTRDFISVEDVVDANLIAMKADIQKNQVFNIATGKETNIRELVSLLNGSMGKSIEPEFTDPRDINDVTKSVADITKAKDVLGFEAKTSLKDGLDKLIGIHK